MKRGRTSVAALSVVPLNPTSRRIQPPSDLTATELQLFREIVAATSSDHFVATDAFLLGLYCQAICASRRCAKAMVKDTEPKLLLAWEKSTRMAALLATKLRLTPTGRFDGQTAFRRSKKHAPSAYDTMSNDDD